MSLTFRSDFIDNMHTFYNVAKIYLNLHLIFMHFQFHEIFPKLWKWEENRNIVRFHIFFCHITYIFFFLYSFVEDFFFKFQELPVSTCTDIYFLYIFNFTRYSLISISREYHERARHCRKPLRSRNGKNIFTTTRFT